MITTKELKSTGKYIEGRGIIETIDTVINKFIAENNINEENLIDIKYSVSTKNNNVVSFALIIYKQK